MALIIPHLLFFGSYAYVSLSKKAGIARHLRNIVNKCDQPLVFIGAFDGAAFRSLRFQAALYKHSHRAIEETGTKKTRTFHRILQVLSQKRTVSPGLLQPWREGRGFGRLRGAALAATGR